MKKLPRLGLFCSTYDGTLSTNRSIKLSSLSKQKVLEIASKNLNDFPKIVEFCKARNISMFRLGNSCIPFASHKEFDQTIWEELKPLFAQINRSTLAHTLRLTIHPGQFIQLGSKNPNVVESSLEELRYCTKLLECLKAGNDGVITLHLGGTNGDKKATMERFCEVFEQNLWLGKYLALENDEYNFTASETLEVAKRCGIGMIFDIFHHSINPSDVIWEDIKRSWGTKRPKLHISSQGSGKTGHHSDFIASEDLVTLQNFLGEDFFEVDIMIEAKHKEDAIEQIFETFKN